MSPEQTRAAKHRRAGGPLCSLSLLRDEKAAAHCIDHLHASGETLRFFFPPQSDATVRPLHEAPDAMEEAASQLEREHVHSVYNKIAPYFNDSRYKAWPKVRQFLLDLQPGSIVADVGRRPALRPAGAA